MTFRCYLRSTLIIHETGKHSKQIIIGNNHYYIEGIKTPSCDVVTAIHLLYHVSVTITHM